MTAYAGNLKLQKSFIALHLKARCQSLKINNYRIFFTNI